MSTTGDSPARQLLAAWQAATAVAVEAVRNWKGEGVRLVRFVCFDERTLAAYTSALSATCRTVAGKGACGTALATSMGPLTVTNGGTLTIPGLWSLAFGNGDSDKPLTTLFYTAGFADQTDGVFGSIAATTTSTTPPSNPY